MATYAEGMADTPWRPISEGEVYDPAPPFTDEQWQQLHRVRDYLSYLIGQDTHPGGPIRAIRESEFSLCPGRRNTAEVVRLLNQALSLANRWDEGSR